jgi:hypothetical protein
LALWYSGLVLRMILSSLPALYSSDQTRPPLWGRLLRARMSMMSKQTHNLRHVTVRLGERYILANRVEIGMVWHDGDGKVPAQRQ